MNTDPLDDSDDEENADENTRADLRTSTSSVMVFYLANKLLPVVLRLRIISRLRGKEPTPEPEPLPLSFHPYSHRSTRH